MAEPTPSTAMHQGAASAPTSKLEADSPTTDGEHVMTVRILAGTGGNNSTDVDSNLAMGTESSPKYPDDKVKVDVIAEPDSLEQVTPFCRICKEGKTGDEDPLICLGCSCPSDLRQAHRSCIKVYFGRRVKRGEHFCRLCRDVLRHHIYKLALGNSGDDTDDDKRGSLEIPAKQVGFKGIRIYPTPPSLSDHHVQMPPTRDENVRRAEQELYTNRMLDRLALSVLIVLTFFIVALIICLLLYIF